MVRKSAHSIVATPAGGLKLLASVRDHEVATDQPERAGGEDTAPTPLELLSVSLASCIALYVHKYCAARALATDELAVEVKPIWRNDPGRIGRFDVVIHVPESIPAEHHAAIEEVALTCPVHHTLTHTPEITMRLEAQVEAPALAGD
jgi:putative redox protein